MNVPSKLNPADIASHGAKIISLNAESEWIKGPAFLESDINDWPTKQNSLNSDLKELETKYFQLNLSIKSDD